MIASSCLFERVVFVYCDCVLEVESFCFFGTNFDGANYLAAVHALEEVAILDRETGAEPFPPLVSARLPESTGCM
jgi:hypothetical protein